VLIQDRLSDPFRKGNIPQDRARCGEVSAYLRPLCGGALQNLRRQGEEPQVLEQRGLFNRQSQLYISAPQGDSATQGCDSNGRFPVRAVLAAKTTRDGGRQRVKAQRFTCVTLTELVYRHQRPRDPKDDGQPNGEESSDASELLKGDRCCRG
jgi:hypothetical protein